MDGLIGIITGFIGGLLYPLFSVIFVFIQGIQAVFYAFAGIGGTIKFQGDGDITAGNTGDKKDTGLLYYLFQHDIVRNLLVSIMLLALFLVIIFTVMAFIKNAYSAKQKNWKEIIGNAIKGLANFIFIPVCCMFGVWLGNILLQAINGATSTGGSNYMDRKLFIACAYNANTFRNGETDDNDVPVEDQLPDENQQKVIERLEKMAEKNKLTYISTGEKYDWSRLDKCKTNGDYAELVDDIYSNTNISIYDWISVEKCYSLFEINYVVLIVGGIFMLYVLCSLAFAMVRRMFLLIILFVISPGICAMYPLDEGKAVGSWKGEFVKLVLSAYGAVAGMNIFFSLMPLIDKIQLFAGDVGGVTIPSVATEIIQIFILVSGLLCVKELIGTISRLVGGEDALSTGSSLMKNTTGAIKKRVTGAAGVFTKAAGAKAGGGNFFGSLGKQALDATKGIFFDDKKFKEDFRKEKDTTVKDRNIKKLSNLAKAAQTDEERKNVLIQAKRAGVEKEIAEVLAYEDNKGRIKRAGRNEIVALTSGEKILEQQKTAKEQVDAKKDFDAAIDKSNEAKQEARTKLATMSASAAARIGGRGFIENAMMNREKIDINDSWNESTKNLALEINKIIGNLAKMDSAVETAAGKYEEATKNVTKVSDAIVDKRSYAYVDSRGRTVDASSLRGDDVKDDFAAYLTGFSAVGNGLTDQLDKRISAAVDSLDRFSSALKNQTDASLRETARNKSRAVSEQSKKGK